jgi:hypothetical protein
MKGRDHRVNLDVDAEALLKWIVKKLIISLRVGQWRTREHDNKTWVS